MELVYKLRLQKDAKKVYNQTITTVKHYWVVFRLQGGRWPIAFAVVIGHIPCSMQKDKIIECVPY